jgi:hypothetical protein
MAVNFIGRKPEYPKKTTEMLQVTDKIFIGYKNVFGPIAVLVTNRFRLEQKSYLPLKLE